MSGRAAALTHPLTQRQIAAALLTTNDVPAGYARTKVTDSSAADATGTCPNAKDPFKSATLAKGEADFSRGALGPFILEFVAQQRPGSAAKGMAAFRRLLLKCGRFKTTSSDGSTETGRLRPESFPHLADDTIAVRVTVHSKTGGTDFALAGDFVAIRSHDVIVLVAGFGLVAGPPASTLVKVTRRAVAKVRRAQG